MVKQDQYLAPCPAHDDNDPSLYIKQVPGKVLMFCMSGCQTGDVLRAANMEWACLFDNHPHAAVDEWAAIQQKIRREERRDRENYKADQFWEETGYLDESE